MPAVMLTAASGALVPKATIVRPITICGIPILSASEDEPSTKISAPFIRSTNPTIRSRKLTGNGMINISFLKKV